MSEPQIVEYIADIDDRLERITNELNVTKLHLELAVKGGVSLDEYNALKKEYDDLNEEHNELLKKCDELEQQKKNLAEDLQILKGKHYETGPEKVPNLRLQVSTNQKDSTGETQREKTAGENGTEGQHDKDGGADSNCTGDKQSNQGASEGSENKVENNGHDKKPGKKGGKNKRPTGNNGKDKQPAGNNGKDKQPAGNNEDKKPSNRKPPVRNAVTAKAANDDYLNVPTQDTYEDVEEHRAKLQKQYPGCTIKFTHKYQTRSQMMGVPAVCKMIIKHCPIFKVCPPGREPFNALAEGTRYADEFLNEKIPADATFIASVIYNRICMQIPLNRQLKSLRDFGLDMDLTKLSRWNIMFTNEYLKPVADYMWETLFDGYRILQLDESRWTCVEKGKGCFAFLARSSELGEYDENGHRKPTICCVMIREDRHCDFLIKYLKGKYHILVVDGYSGYVALLKIPDLNISISGCMVHARRPHIESFDVLPADIRKDPEKLMQRPEWLFLATLGNMFHYDTPTKTWDRDHRQAARMYLVKPFVEFFFESEEMLRQKLNVTAAEAKADEEDETAQEEEDKKRMILTKINKIMAMLKETGAISDDFDGEPDNLDALIEKLKIEVDEKIAYLREKRDSIFAALDPLTVSSHLKKAIGYKMNHESDFMTFLTDPDVPMENNASERMARNVAFVRMNSFFTRNERGSDALQSQFTLCLTARENGANPFVYLVYVLTSVAKYKRDHCMERDDNNFSEEFLKTMMPWSKEYLEYAQRETNRLYYGWLTGDQEHSSPLGRDVERKRNNEGTDLTPDTDDTNPIHDTKDTDQIHSTDDTNPIPSTEGTNTDNADPISNTDDTDLIPNTDDTDLTPSTEDADQIHSTDDTNPAHSTENTGSSHNTMTLDELLDIMKEAPNTFQRSKPAACNYTGEHVLKAPSKAQQKKARGP